MYVSKNPDMGYSFHHVAHWLIASQIGKLSFLEKEVKSSVFEEFLAKLDGLF